MRSDVVAVGVVELCNVGGLASEPHSMDRRLHDVVRRDVVVAGQRQPRRLHGDPATRNDHVASTLTHTSLWCYQRQLNDAGFKEEKSVMIIVNFV